MNGEGFATFRWATVRYDCWIYGAMDSDLQRAAVQRWQAGGVR